MEETNFPFVLRESMRRPGFTYLAVREAKVACLFPVENRVSSKTGGQYKQGTVNLQIAVEGASRGAFLHATVMGKDAAMIENGQLKVGDTISCLLDLDIHTYGQRTYQDVMVEEIEVIPNLSEK